MRGSDRCSSCALVGAAVLLLLGAARGDAAGVCVGDCNQDGRVVIAEVQRCVNLGSDIPSVACASADQNLDEQVDENEVSLCIQSFLDASTCPMVFTPVPTPTHSGTPGPTDTPRPTGSRAPTSTRTPTRTQPPTATRTYTPVPTATWTATPLSIGSHACTFTGSLTGTLACFGGANDGSPCTRASDCPGGTCSPSACFGGANDGSPCTRGSDCPGGTCGPGVSGSAVVIATQALPLPPNPATGAIDIDCGTVDPETGKASCECIFQSFEPMNLIGIGFICFTPGSPCPAGEIDCNGGNAVDITMSSDHNIGTCTGNPDCEAQCEAYCAPNRAFNSACEGFCEGGTRDGLSCQCDKLGTSACPVPANTLECPDGSCPGKDGLGQHTNTCQCDCLTVGGAPSRAGGLQCNLPVNINVETGAPCGDGDILIAVGTRCIPLTTEQLSSQLTDTNNTAGKMFPAAAPFTGAGEPTACTAMATSVTTGLTLVGSVNFFDSTIGDLQTIEKLICQ